MIHKLSELTGMNREQLESIAGELNLKGIKKLDDENLRFQILDAEARVESLKPTPETDKPKARRGRPPKKAAAAAAAEPEKEVPKKEKPPKAAPAPKAEEAPAKEEKAEAAEKAPAATPKKRGRKPKANPEAAPAPEQAISGVSLREANSRRASSRGTENSDSAPAAERIAVSSPRTTLMLGSITP